MAVLGTANIRVRGENSEWRRVSRQTTREINRMQRSIRSTDRRMRRMDRTVARLQRTLGGLRGIVLGGLGFAGVTVAVTQMVQAMRDADKWAGIIRNTLDNMGGTAGRTGREIEQLAQSVHRVAGGDLNEIRGAASQLLVIAENSKIAGDNIDRTLRLAQDMAATGFGDLKGNVEEITEVLALPAEAVATLEKYNVFFNDAAKAHLDYLTETNQELAAMELIYEKMEAKFKGAAVAGTTAFDRALKDANTEYTGLKETLGEVIVEAGHLTGAFNLLAGAARAVKTFFDRTVLEGRREFADKTDEQLRSMLKAAEATLQEVQSVSAGPQTRVTGRRRAEAGGNLDEALAERARITREIGIRQSERSDRMLAELANRTAQAAIDRKSELAALAAANARSDHHSRKFVRDWTGQDEKDSKDTKKAVEDSAARTIRNARRELNFLREYGQTEGRRRAQAEGLFRLIQQTDGKFTREQGIEYAGILGRTFDEQERQSEIQKMKDNIKEITGEFASGITSMGKTIGQFVADGEWNMEKFREAGFNALSSLVSRISDKVLWEPLETAVSDAIANILIDAGINAAGARAAGGYVKGGTPYMVGERGPEMFVPQGSGYIHSANQSARMQAGATVNFSPTINSSDPAAVRTEMVRLLPQFIDAAKSAVAYEGTRPGPIRTRFE